MYKSANDKPRESWAPKHPDVRISVEHFGPIEEGEIDLRPLTIFVGPSNTGKTYLAVLVYAIHRILHGFPRFPVSKYHSYFWSGNFNGLDDEIKDILSKLNPEEWPFFFSDLPQIVRDHIQEDLDNPQVLANLLTGELERCFDLETITDMIRVTEKSVGAKINLQINGEEQSLWNFHMSMTESGVESEGKIENAMLLRDEFHDLSSYEETIMGIRDSLEHEFFNKKGGAEIEEEMIYLLRDLINVMAYPEKGKPSGIYYLPADRSGIMHSHRVISSSLMARSTRAGLERFPELPTFSGVTADFLEHLILYDQSRVRSDVRAHQDIRRNMKNIADRLENKTLGGRIQAISASPGGYPGFVYRPRDMKHDIRLSRTSSMVSELASVVLFIRGSVEDGDTLIIEEPEAHLHPAAQTEMAAVLADLVGAGVRVVITTHSDWLLQEVGNLMRQGELEEKAGKSEVSSAGTLRPSDVGVWLFHRDKTDRGSTVREVPFDRVGGIEPSDYEDIAEELYNRSAELQNRLEEAGDTDAGDTE